MFVKIDIGVNNQVCLILIVSRLGRAAGGRPFLAEQVCGDIHDRRGGGPGASIVSGRRSREQHSVTY
jgi:hypothetical protein